MLRRLFTAASALSLLLCAGVLLLWVRSYRSSDRLFVQWRWKRVSATSVLGYTSFWVHTLTRPDVWVCDYSIDHRIAPGLYRLDTSPWFGHQGPATWHAAAPDWFVILMAAILPSAWMITARQRAAKRRSAGFPIRPTSDATMLPNKTTGGSTQANRPSEIGEPVRGAHQARSAREGASDAPDLCL